MEADRNGQDIGQAPVLAEAAADERVVGAEDLLFDPTHHVGRGGRVECVLAAGQVGAPPRQHLGVRRRRGAVQGQHTDVLEESADEGLLGVGIAHARGHESRGHGARQGIAPERDEGEPVAQAVPVIPRQAEPQHEALERVEP